MGRWKKSKSFIIRNNNLLKNYRQSDRCYKLITIIWREKKIARNVATGNGSNSRSHFKISKFSVISQRAFFFIQMIKLNGWRLRKFLSGNRWRSLARFFLLAHFFILALIFFLFFQKSEEYSVAVAVRLHKTLELAGDKFYMITCGKAGFQNSRYVNFWIEVVGKLSHHLCETGNVVSRHSKFVNVWLPMFFVISKYLKGLLE